MNFDINLPDGWYKIKGDGSPGSPNARRAVYWFEYRYHFWVKVSCGKMTSLAGFLEDYIEIPESGYFPVGGAGKLVAAVEAWGTDIQPLVISDLRAADEWLDEFKVRL